MSNQPDSHEQGHQRKEVPAPVRLALEALEVLQAEDAALAAESRRKLPGFALRLAAAGEEVTVERLLANARAKEIDKPEAPKPAQKNYKEIVSAFPVVEQPVREDTRITDVIRAAKNNDLDALKLLVSKGEEVRQYDWSNEIKTIEPDTLRTAALNGSLDVVKYIVEECTGYWWDFNRAFVDAAREGHLEVLKYLAESGRVDIPAHRGAALEDAAFKGHVEIARYLVEVCEADVHGRMEYGRIRAYTEEALNKAAEGGSLAMVKYLVEECGADVHCGGAWLVHAAMNGHLDVLKYFVEVHNLNIHAHDELPLRHAADRNREEILDYLVERGANIHIDKEDITNTAITYGRISVAKRFVEKYGADLSVLPRELQERYADYNELSEARQKAGDSDLPPFYKWIDAMEYLAGQGAPIHTGRIADGGLNNYREIVQEAVNNDRWPLVKRLVEKYDADFSFLPVDDLEKYIKYRKLCKKWQKVAHTDAPYAGIKEDPHYFRPVAYKAVLRMLKREDYHDLQATAFHASSLFGTEDRVLQYLEKWGKAGKQPLHDLIYRINLPEKKTREMDVTAWADAVLKCGPSMAKLVQFADRLPVPLKSDDGRTWSMKNTRDAVAQFMYARAQENPELAALCFENNVGEKNFNKALELSKNPPTVKNIPDIVIDGAAFDMPGATFHRLAANDVRGLFLGELTDCCQSIGGAGRECAEHGFTSKDSGFYVVEDKGRIKGQAWAWRGENKELGLDSQETHGENVSEEQWLKLTKAFAKAIAKNPGDITALVVGTGGATPDKVVDAFKKATTPAKPAGYEGYRDSHKQVVVWEKKAGMNG